MGISATWLPYFVFIFFFNSSIKATEHDRNISVQAQGISSRVAEHIVMHAMYIGINDNFRLSSTGHERELRHRGSVYSVKTSAFILQNTKLWKKIVIL